MSRVYVGNRVQSVDIGEELQKISRVIIAVDSDHVYTAGDDTGRTIERECPWGSQEMADAILRKLSGVAYQPFSAERALLSPAFEIGDAVTVGGVYSQIVGADINYGVSGLVDIYAPDLDVIEDEYPAEKTQQSSINRELAKTRSSITKTAEQIRLEVANEIEGLSSSITIELDGIRQEVQGAEDAISYLEVDLDAITGRVKTAEGDIASLELTTEEFGVRIETAEGDIAALELTTEDFGVRIETAEGDIAGLELTTEEFGVRIEGAEGAITYLEADLDAITGRVEDAEGNIGALELTTKEFGVRIEDAEGGIASLEVTVGELSLEISGKIDGESAQTLIDQTVEKITLEASSANGSSTFTLKVGEIELSTQKLMLSVDAAHITGQLVIGEQLPSNLATTSDIPTRVSELYNDEGYETARGVTTIIEGTVTTDYVNALGVYASYLQGETITIKTSDGLRAGQIDVAYTTTGYGLEFSTVFGGILLNPMGNFWVDAMYGSMGITESGIVCGVPPVPENSSVALGSYAFPWEDLYTAYGTFSELVSRVEALEAAATS